MPEHQLITFVIFTGFFLFTTSLLHTLTKKYALVPYTSALLLVGLISQILLENLGIHLHLALTSNTIFFVLLPLLLFESAMKINFHQFKLQFKTITFLATFGLLTSMLVVGIGIWLLLGFDFTSAILFGAIISATDPIAVLALFKSLGAPKRLGLLAEGESMFNDATAVIAFKTLSVFAVAGTTIATTDIALSLGNFLLVFTGSIAFGAALGYIVALVIARIDNDRIVETTLTISTALLSFVIAEHYFHLSGVIAAVVAGITVGNLGKTKISGGVVEFMEELWEYVGFLAISLVFFFATFNLDTQIFTTNIHNSLLIITIVLIARSISVYLSFFASNTLHFFNNEPNVPLSWQHIINWGGMRGVIPLVLVYALPDSFAYKQDFLTFTLATFMFTLFINGITIRWLMTFLKIHLPKNEEKIIHEEEEILHLEEAKSELKQLPTSEFDNNIVDDMIRQINKEEKQHKKTLFDITTPTQLEKSLRIQSIKIELETVKQLFQDGHINENVYFDLENELDLQLDALEHPEVNKGRSYQKDGKINSGQTFTQRLSSFTNFHTNHPMLGRFLNRSQEQLIFNRLLQLRARIVSSQSAIKYLKILSKTSHSSRDDKNAIKSIVTEHKAYIRSNQSQLNHLKKKHPHLSEQYQQKLLTNLLKPHLNPRN